MSVRFRFLRSKGRQSRLTACEGGFPLPYDEGLAQRVREALQDHPSVSEKMMFGGLAFLISGNMCIGVVGDQLMARVGPDRYQEALGESHVREMDFTGRPMKGFVYISSEGLDSDEELEAWTQRGVDFAASLPAR